MIEARKNDIINNDNQKSILFAFPIEQEGEEMDWQQEYISKLNKEMSDVREEIRGLRTEMRGMQQEIKADIQSMIIEMRDRDNQRHQEILAVQTNIDKNVADLKKEISDSNKWVQGLIITTIIGIVAITVSVISFVANH